MFGACLCDNMTLVNSGGHKRPKPDVALELSLDRHRIPTMTCGVSFLSLWPHQPATGVFCCQYGSGQNLQYSIQYTQIFA